MGDIMFLGLAILAFAAFSAYAAACASAPTGRKNGSLFPQIASSGDLRARDHVVEIRDGRVNHSSFPSAFKFLAKAGHRRIVDT